MRWLLLIPAVYCIYMAIVVPRSHEDSLRVDGAMLRSNKRNLTAIGRHLRDYKKIHGAYPTNDQGLLIVKPLVEAITNQDGRDPALNRCRLLGCGVTSCFGDPFIYENRNANHGSFSDSGANDNPNSVYSLKVDRGVYVWSIGARQAYEKYNAERSSITVRSIEMYAVGAALLAGYIAVVVITTRRARARGRISMDIPAVVLLDTVLLAAAGAIAFYRQPSVIACYLTSYTNPPSVMLTEDYLSLMEKYHKGGVISDAAYKKIKENAWNYELLKPGDDEKGEQ